MIAAFERYADAFLANRIDGAQFVCISIPQLNHQLGITNYNHRLHIVTWLKRYLEVSPNFAKFSRREPRTAPSHSYCPFLRTQIASR